LERTVRSLAAQGVDPRAVNVDWYLANRQKDRAVEDVKAELLLDRIATRGKHRRDEEDVENKWKRWRNAVANPLQAVRANLTRQGALDRMKSNLRSQKTLIGSVKILGPGQKLRKNECSSCRGPLRTLKKLSMNYSEDSSPRATTLVPMVVEQTNRGERAYDIYSGYSKITSSSSGRRSTTTSRIW